MKIVITELMQFLAVRILPDPNPRGRPLGGAAATRRIMIGAITEEAPHAIVRPIRREPWHSLDDLAVAGGPYDVGAVLDLVNPERWPPRRVPAEEFVYDDLLQVGRWDGGRVWAARASLAVETLDEIVDFTVSVEGQRPFIRNRASDRSLGFLMGCEPPVLTVSARGFPVCEFREPRLGDIRLVITDLRFYHPADDEIVNPEALRDVNARLQAGVEFQLAIELPPMYPEESPTRGFAVGGVHLRDDPGWATATRVEPPPE